MKGDFSRITRESNYRESDYKAVLKQQGRVDLDADWNEQVWIERYREQTINKDVIGLCGVPARGDGFKIMPSETDSEGGPDLAISPGRIYVDGILCELTERTRYSSQADYPEPTDITLPDGERETSRQSAENAAIIFERTVPTNVQPGEDFEVRVEITAKRALDLAAFTDELPPEFELVSSETTAFQQDMESGDTLSASYTVRATKSTGSFDVTGKARATGEEEALSLSSSIKVGIGRADLVYLDVWNRHITCIEDPSIREVALGGVDTTTRLKTVCQVKVLEDVDAQNCQDIDDLEHWPPMPSQGRLSTDVDPTAPADNPCLLPPEGGFRGLENRLYRVEIHDGGGMEEATFKVSRDNGSVVFGIVHFPASNKIQVERMGRDRILALRVGDWVEVLGDKTELHGNPGTMAQIEDINHADRVVRLSEDVSHHDGEGHPKVRRWDQDRDAISVRSDRDDGFIELEDGILVEFSGGNFQTGDYWTFAARTAPGDAERFTDGVERLCEAPPQGIKHHYCPLALIHWSSEERGLVTEDAKPDLAFLRKVSEDGRSWTFRLQPGLFLADGTPFNSNAVRDILQDRADMEFESIDTENELSITINLNQAIQNFLKWLSTIQLPMISYKIEDCRPVFPPLSRTEPGIKITEVRLNNNDSEYVLKDDSEVEIQNFADGIQIFCDQPIDDVSLHNQHGPLAHPKPTCFVTVRVPHLWNQVVVGYQPIILATGTLDIAREDQSIIRWIPHPYVENWLRESSEFPENRVLAQLTLKGNFIWGANDPDRYLDGEAYGIQGSDGDSDRKTHLQLPSGDGRRGGDFEMWFWLIADETPSDHVIISEEELMNTINMRDRAELARIPYIGEHRADNIIRERESQPFESLDDLQRIRGIGPNVVKKIRESFNIQ